MINIKKYIFRKQDDLKDCGATCLSMIVEYYDGFINMEKLRELTKTTKEGTNAYNIVEAAKKLGFSSYGIKYSFNKKIPLPAIAHVIIKGVYKHFIVIYEINFKKKYLIIADPANKITKISFNEFNKIFSNVIIILYPNRKIEKEKKITIYRYLKSYLFSINSLKLFLISFIFIIFSFLYIFVIKNIINGHINKKIILITIILIFLKFLINLKKDNIALNLSLKTSYNLMNNTFKDIILLPYTYYRNRTTGEIITRINDIDNVKDINNIIVILLTNLSLVLISLIILYFINNVLFLNLVLFLTLYLIIYKKLNKKITNTINNLKVSKSLLNSYMTESIIGFESIKGSNLETAFITKFKEKTKDYLSIFKTYQKIQNKLHNLNDLIIDIINFITILLGILLINQNKITFGDLIIFYTIENYVLDPFKNLIDIKIILSDIKISFKRLIELKYQNKSNLKKAKYDDIILDNLSFELSDKKIINNLSLKIKKKDKIILVGSSGRGKSTILKILKQYYQTNKVYISKENIQNIDLKNKITYISQDEYLFTDTLYNNITMYKKVDENKLNKIIKICCLNEIIKKDNLGLNMLIEENGFNLSGGEKQRIILARALVHIKDYLFIDEGLSEVDISLERKIIKNLLKNYKDKTIIIVSHRMDNADLFKTMIKLDTKEILRKEDLHDH